MQTMLGYTNLKQSVPGLSSASEA